MKRVLLVSGGVDSMVMLAKAEHLGDASLALSFDYGQRHRRELFFAVAIADYFKTAHRVVDLTGFGRMLTGSSQTDASVPVPHGHYADESMKTTLVPNRNMVMLAVAAAIAIAEKCDEVGYAAHAGDHAIYPDCRPEFVHRITALLGVVDYRPIGLWAPFITSTKAAIIQLGDALGAPLKQTWSCYEGGAIHCGKCGTCVERREAFQLAGVHDPTIYADAARPGGAPGPSTPA